MLLQKFQQNLSTVVAMLVKEKISISFKILLLLLWLIILRVSGVCWIIQLNTRVYLSYICYYSYSVETHLFKMIFKLKSDIILELVFSPSFKIERLNVSHVRAYSIQSKTYSSTFMDNYKFCFHFWLQYNFALHKQN